MARDWWEEYTCGCVSTKATSEKRLLGYCPDHGTDRRALYRGMVPADDKTRKIHRDTLDAVKRKEEDDGP